MIPLTFSSDSSAEADSPLGLDTSKTASTDAARMKSVASTKCRPGQMRLPAPKASEIIDGSLMRGLGPGVVVPSSSPPAAEVVGAVFGRKRSGLNVSGSGKSSGSCRIPLGNFKEDV